MPFPLARSYNTPARARGNGMKMLRCPRCRKDCIPAANFCGRCGLALDHLRPRRTPGPSLHISRSLIWAVIICLFFFMRAVSRDKPPPVKRYSPPTPQRPIHLPERQRMQQERWQHSAAWQYRDESHRRTPLPAAPDTHTNSPSQWHQSHRTPPHRPPASYDSSRGHWKSAAPSSPASARKSQHSAHPPGGMKR